MKLIGKQIVVELPEKAWTEFGNPRDLESECKGFNDCLTEVARMNPAMEVDEEKVKKLCKQEIDWLNTNLFSKKSQISIGNMDSISGYIAQALASNPSAWLKRKETDEYKNH